MNYDNVLRPNYYGIVTADVRYDEDLVPAAKLLYSELTCLSFKEGYTYASNNYFAALYKVSASTVSRWIKSLADKGYITIEYVYKNNECTERHIYIANVRQQKTEDVSNGETGVAQNETGVAQNETDIAQNETDIAQNETDIAQNETDIAQNETDIAQNETDIAQNETGIAKMQGGYCKNAIGIAKMQQVLQKCNRGIAKMQGGYCKNAKVNNTRVNNTRVNNTRYCVAESTENEPQPQTQNIEPKTKDQKQKYGEYQNVLLTDSEFEKLKNDFGTEKANGIINNFSSKKEMMGYKYKSDYLAIRKWGVEAYENDLVKNKSKIPKKFTPIQEHEIEMTDEDRKSIPF